MSAAAQKSKRGGQKKRLAFDLIPNDYKVIELNARRLGRSSEKLVAARQAKIYFAGRAPLIGVNETGSISSSSQPNTSGDLN